MQIRARLALFFAAGTAVLIALGGILFVHTLSTGLRNGLVTSLQSRAATVAQNVRNGGSSTGLGTPAPDQPGGAISDQDEIAQILDPTGRVLASTRPGGGSAVLKAAEIGAAQHDELVLRRSVSGFDTSMLLFATSVRDPDHLIVVTGQTLETVDNATHGVVLAFVVGGPVTVVLAAVAAWLIAGGALRPVERMRRQAADISAHDREAKLDVPRTGDEIAALGRTLNGLLGRLQGALGRQRGFAATAGHELRTPLANLKLELELAGRPGRSQGQLRAAVAEAAGEVDRLTRLAEDLLILARQDDGAPLVLPVEHDVVGVVAAAVEGFAPEAERRGVQIEPSGPSHLLAPIDDARFRQVIDNLLDNAVRFAPAGSRVEVHVREGETQLSLEVADAGPGFEADFLPRAFERFSRYDDGRARNHGGAGLGLAIVKSLTEAHGGRVDAGNRPSGGALVRVTIPRSPRRTGVDHVAV